MGATETQITRLALGFLIGIIIVAFIILRLLAFINRKRNQNSLNVQEKKETSLSKVEWIKIYNAQNIVETEQLVEMLKQNGIAAFSQEAGANVAMHGAPGFGIYGVDIFVKTDDAENNWTYTWSDLDQKKAGKDIAYTVEETGKAAGYISTVTLPVLRGFPVHL